MYPGRDLQYPVQNCGEYKFCFTVHFNSLNVTHQLMYFQYNNILERREVPTWCSNYDLLS